MKISKVKSLLLLISIFLVSIAVSHPSLTTPGTTTIYVDPPTIADLTYTPGHTFSINISVSDVQDLWGYTVVISYNTTVLTATDYHSYDPFTTPGLSRINDTAGWVYIYFSMPFGAPEGVSGNMPLVKVDFTVEALGVSILDVHSTKLANAKGLAITHDVVDGSFSNILKHDVAVTSVTASPYRVDPGGSVSLNVIVANNGDFDETNVTVTVMYGSVLIGEETNLYLLIGENITRAFTWDTTGLTIGEYDVKAEARIAIDNYPTDNDKSIKVRVGVIRDVAVINVTASQPVATVGESVIVRVTIRNLGNFTETVTVVARYSGELIGRTTNQVLEKRTNASLTFNWQTEGVPTGDYVLSGEAVVDIDDNPANNILEGDTVTVTSTSGIPIIFLYVGGGIVALIVVIIVLRFALRARKHPPAPA